MKFKVGQTVLINPKVRSIPVEYGDYFPFHLVPEMIKRGGMKAVIMEIANASHNSLQQALLRTDDNSIRQYIRNTFPKSQSEKMYRLTLDDGYSWPDWLMADMDLFELSIY